MDSDNSSNYYYIDNIMGIVLTKWYVYTFASIAFIAMGIMVVDFPVISHYFFAFAFISVGVAGLLVALHVKKYLRISDGATPHLFLGETSIIGALMSLVGEGPSNIRKSQETDFSRQIHRPRIDKDAFVSWDASVIGDVIIGKNVFLGPHSFVRGDEGHPLFVGDDSNVQDCAGLHALETEEFKNGKWEFLDGRRFSDDGERLSSDSDKNGYAVYIGKRVSVAHQAIVHGPAYVGDDTFVGLQAQVFNAKVGNNCFVGVQALVTNGVVIADGRFVPPGSVITEQSQADALGRVEDTQFSSLNAAVVHVNKSLADKGRENSKRKEVGFKDFLGD